MSSQKAIKTQKSARKSRAVEISTECVKDEHSETSGSSGPISPPGPKSPNTILHNVDAEKFNTTNDCSSDLTFYFIVQDNVRTTTNLDLSELAGIDGVEWLNAYYAHYPAIRSLHKKAPMEYFMEHCNTIAYSIQQHKTFTITYDNLLPVFMSAYDKKPTSGAIYERYKSIICAKTTSLCFSYDMADSSTVVKKIAYIITSLLMCADHEVSAVNVKCRFMTINRFTSVEMKPRLRKNFAFFDIFNHGDIEPMIKDLAENYMDDWFKERTQIIQDFKDAGFILSQLKKKGLF